MFGSILRGGLFFRPLMTESVDSPDGIPSSIETAEAVQLGNLGEI